MVLPDTLYRVMAPIGQMHAREIARSVDAICQQACTHSAMAGALVARGMAPAEAFYTVMAWEGADMLIPPQIRLGPVPSMGAGPVLGPQAFPGIGFQGAPLIGPQASPLLGTQVMPTVGPIPFLPAGAMQSIAPQMADPMA